MDSREYEKFNHFPHIQLSLSATTSKNEGICHCCSEVRNDLVIRDFGLEISLELICPRLSRKLAL